HLEVLGEQVPAGGGVAAEGRERAGGATGGDAQLHPTAAERVEHGRILGGAQRVVDRQGEHGGAQRDVGAVLRRGGEEHEGRGQPSFVLSEVVLGDPGGGEAEFIGAADLLEGEAVAVGGGRVLEQAGEQAQSGCGHGAGISSRRGWRAGAGAAGGRGGAGGGGGGRRGGGGRGPAGGGGGGGGLPGGGGGGGGRGRGVGGGFGMACAGDRGQQRPGVLVVRALQDPVDGTVLDL